MSTLRKLACILLSFCSAAVACNETDPSARGLWEKRLTRARLTGAGWQPCCRKAEIRTVCKEKVDSREKALELLRAAGGPCLDDAVAAVEIHAPEDLAAAYLIRGERNDDPGDYLLALKTATGFNRALALHRLGLKKEAIAAWDAVVKEGSAWRAEARAFRDALLKAPEPVWRPEDAESFARRFTSDAVEFFEGSVIRDLEAARRLAGTLAATGEPFPRAVIEAIDRPGGEEALRRAFGANGATDLDRAATLLERAGNPLHLTLRFKIAEEHFVGRESLALLDALAPITPPEYRELTYRSVLLRANALEYEDRYLEAHTAYADALSLTYDEPTRVAEVLARRSANFSTIGLSKEALRDSLSALRLLDRVADLKTRHLAYGSAALAAERLGHPDIALHYQNAAVEAILNVPNAPEARSNLAVAVRRRAEILLNLGREGDAQRDLTDGAALAKGLRGENLLQMRLSELKGQALLNDNPRAAVRAFTQAIELAREQDSTYRAVLLFKRATARGRAGDRQADEDMIAALRIVREEAKGLIDSAQRGRYEQVWDPYFSRFQEMHRQMIKERIDDGDDRAAFVFAERARAFEPMHLLLRTQSVPGFRPIETKEDLAAALASLPADTAILQYLVLPDETYTWLLTREGVKLFRWGAGRDTIERWVTRAAEAVDHGHSESFKTVMRAAYAALFRDVLPKVKTRLVIVPDDPMHALPFAGLQDSRNEQYLVERASTAVAGSTSLYLYALARDAQFSADANPSVLLVGNPTLHERSDLAELPYARQEAEELKREFYPGAHLLTGVEATIDRFLGLAKTSTIIHFAGHAVANPHQPWKSRLMLAPGKGDSGELTAERLVRELLELERTRLVVLGACSTAGGQPAGPRGLAPLVRPLIAANVPAVVGTLWDVSDATAKQLLGSLHCHHRRGDDVAVALQQAQLMRLRDKEPAMMWAPYQVVGYAGSPYARPASEETRSDPHVCTENSLQRPDGLHSQ